MRVRVSRTTLARVLLLTALAAAPAGAQIISPGKLAEAHAELEGIRSCTRCHRLGQAGVDRDRCLECHELLRRRIVQDEGFHAGVAEDDCASCHKDHLGRGFDMLRFDTASFEHRQTGYELEGAHPEAACRDCHRPALVVADDVRAHFSSADGLARTWLGLTTSCAVCHETADPHAGQFPDRVCTDCHGQRTWEGAERFDHAATRYPLTGRHAAVGCSGCHADLAPGPEPRVRYTPVDHRGCATCHDDPHRGAMTGVCETCHGTDGWSRVSPAGVEGRFDHASTGFLLEGGHGTLACAACHDPSVAAGLPGVQLSFPEGARGRAFPRPGAETCRSCHQDPHQGAFASSPGGPACEGCHEVAAWLPADYGIGRHNRDAAYLLEGAHLAVPCASCHRPAGEALVERPAADRCATCHASADPHGGQFGDRDCSSCHSVASFGAGGFDHGDTRFPLDGAHEGLPCASCHEADGDGTVRYAPLGTSCRDCHDGGGS